MFIGYVAAAVVRGVAVGLGVMLVTVWFVDIQIAHIGWVLLFLVAGAALLGTCGNGWSSSGCRRQPLRRRPDHHRRLLQLLRAFQRRDDDRDRAIGFLAAIQQVERFDDPAARQF